MERARPNFFLNMIPLVLPIGGPILYIFLHAPFLYKLFSVMTLTKVFLNNLFVNKFPRRLIVIEPRDALMGTWSPHWSMICWLPMPICSAARLMAFARRRLWLSPGAM